MYKANLEEFDLNNFPIKESNRFLLSQDFIDFFKELMFNFYDDWKLILENRIQQQKEINQGNFPDFLKETELIRKGDWKANPIPQDLLDRRVEITGPVDRKMIINGLNSGARCYMADLEDSQSPTWEGLLDGQVNLYDAVRKKIQFISPEGKKYELKNDLAVLIVRPRGLHLLEKHLCYRGQPISGAFLDFALYFFHNAQEALKRETGPYFYLPKMEGYREAELWAKIFAWSEKKLGLASGTIKVTVLIETISAVFQMNEIIYYLRDNIVGLNCGRWDYIFSFIKKFNSFAEFVLPNRDQVGMDVHFLNSYSLLLIQTCHKRGIHAMGGMSAYIPVKWNEEENNRIMVKVQVDKEREAKNGHDGTWVAHPGLVPVALKVFDQVLTGPNQIHKEVDKEITADDLLRVPSGTITQMGMINNIKVVLHYMAAWLNGKGCVPLNSLMEDLATAEIARSQIWQWVHYRSKLEDGRTIDSHFYLKLMDQVMKELNDEKTVLVASLSKYKQARTLIDETVLKNEFTEFLSLPAYELLD